MPTRRLRPLHRPRLESLESRLLLYGGAIPVPALPTLVTTQVGDRRIFVKERQPDGSLAARLAYEIDGVNWSPHTRGAPPEQQIQEFGRWYQTDLPLMAQMGVNTVRTYHDFGTGTQATQILDACYRAGIKVVMTVDSPSYGSVASLANVETVVNAYKNHPAILMWMVGNEWDINRYYGTFTTIADAAAFTEQAAQRIKQLDLNHPVATAIADPHIFDVHPLSPTAFPFATARPYTSELVTNLVPSVDVWGLQVYRGASFGDVFQQWEDISSEPMFIAEFGADAYDHRIAGENQSMQADFDARLWDEQYFASAAERTTGVSSGALVFAWNDEWWKNGAVTVHDVSNEANPGQPDGFNDEEFFGIVDIDRKPRAVYAALQARFLQGAQAVALNATPTLRTTSQFSGNAVRVELDGKVVFQRAGAQYGGRGITLSVLDEATGIRMRSVQTWDTWADHARFDDLVAQLNTLPVGSHFALTAADESGLIDFNTGQPWNDPPVTRAIQTFQALGSTKIGQVVYQGGWSLIAVKGGPVLGETVSAVGQPAVAQAQLALTALDPNRDRRPNAEAPAPTPVADPTIDEGATLCLLIGANDTAGAPNRFTFTIDLGAPAGVAITPRSGLLTWTTNETLGPGVYPITVRVTDVGTPARSGTRTIQVTVREVNQAPRLDPLNYRSVVAGQTLNLSIKANDDDQPAQTLTFALLEAPANARIDPKTGAFSWTPADNQVGGPYRIKVQVTDDAAAPLSDVRTFSVTVTARLVVPKPPVVSSYQPRDTRKPLSTFKLVFSQAMNAARLRNLPNYTLIGAGQDRKFGTKDDARPRLKSASYDARTRTLTLMTRQTLVVNQPVKLTIRATNPSTGVANASGVLLDGNGDGRAGGNYVLKLG